MRHMVHNELSHCHADEVIIAYTIVHCIKVQYGMEQKLGEKGGRAPRRRLMLGPGNSIQE